jgi:hypothetical protein
MTPAQPRKIVILPRRPHPDHQFNTQRRIFADGRAYRGVDPSYIGYSIGRWIDEDGDGRYDVLEVETRGFKGPRVYDGAGLPLHRDNQSVIKERIYLDKANPNVLHDQITVIDNALTRPWTVTKNYDRDPSPQPVWGEWICAEGQSHVEIGNENYFLSAEGHLMPTAGPALFQDHREVTGK